MPHSRLLMATAAAVAGLFPIGQAAASGPAPSAPSLHAISCATSLVCTAVGGDTAPQVFRTTDGGLHWSAQAASDAVTQLVGVSCPTTSVCLAYGPDAVEDGSWGHVLRTSNAGTSWAIGGATPFTSYHGGTPVACAVADRCFAVNDGPLQRSTNEGRRWLQLTSGSDHVLSCPPGPACFAVGGEPGYLVLRFESITGFGARTRTVAVLPRFTAASDTGPEALTCATSSWCALTISVGARQLLMTTSDGGLRWVTRALPGGVNVFEPVCIRPNVCLLLGPSSLALVTRDGGAHWSQAAPTVRPTHLPAAISCSGMRCYIVSSGDVWVSSNDLRTWTDHPVP